MLDAQTLCSLIAICGKVRPTTLKHLKMFKNVAQAFCALIAMWQSETKHTETFNNVLNILQSQTHSSCHIHIIFMLAAISILGIFGDTIEKTFIYDTLN